MTHSKKPLLWINIRKARLYMVNKWKMEMYSRIYDRVIKAEVKDINDKIVKTKWTFILDLGKYLKTNLGTIQCEFWDNNDNYNLKDGDLIKGLCYLRAKKYVDKETKEWKTRYQLIFKQLIKIG